MAKECLVCNEKIGFFCGEKLNGNVCLYCFGNIAGNMEAILENERNAEGYINYYNEIKRKVNAKIPSEDKSETLNRLFFQEIDMFYKSKFGVGIREGIRLREQKNKREAYAKSFNEFYEYDVVTIINENHGRVDKEKMMDILSEHAKAGWKLHTMYSNELGKNALSLMGFGVNATACEDVLVFERRIPDFD